MIGLRTIGLRSIWHRGVRRRLGRFRVAQSRGLQARRPDRGGEDDTWSHLKVTIETGSPALFPIRRIVQIDAMARTQGAEKGMLSGIHHDSSMSGPDGQIARLRTCHSPKFVDPGVKARRARVLVRETGPPIEFMDKVGAIGGELRMMAGIECLTQNRQPLTRSQRPVLNRLPLRVGIFASGSVRLARTSSLPLVFLLLLLLLRERGTSA